MIKNYLKAAFRNFQRNKFYSLVNILGLATGMACFILIALFIKDELSYDRFHNDHDRIFRITEVINMEGQGENSSSNPFPVGPALKHDYPELIEESVRFFNLQTPVLSLEYDKVKFNEKNLFFVDSGFFKTFTFPLMLGDPRTALSRPNTIILTPELAGKYFGDEDPIGKTLKFEGVINLTVTGILNPIPEQSHFRFEGLISFSTVQSLLGPNFDKSWVWNPCWTYIKLKPGVNASELKKQFPFFVQKYFPDFIKPQVSHNLQALTDIHLHSDLDYEMGPNGDIDDIYIFGAIAIFILVIACINFMNLATARSANRAKEAGIRKVVGAHKGQLIRQFLIESIAISFVSVLVAIVLIEVSMPVFNNIAGKNIQLNLFGDIWLPGLLVCIGLVTGVMAGIYPAFFLSSFDPVTVLKGGKSSGNKNSRMRRVLVVAQFAISITLIISTAVVYQQLKFLKSADLGFQKEQILILTMRPPMVPKADAFKQELLRNNSVKSVATMNEIIGKNHNTHEYNYEGMQAGKWIYFPSLIVSEDFVETFKMEIVAGRDFSKEMKSDDSLGVLVNEALVKTFNWGNPQNAIGKQFNTPTGKEKIIGVVKDFNFVSLLNPIGPFVLDLPAKQGRGFWVKYMAVRISPSNVDGTVKHIRDTWNKMVPQYPFEYFFLDDDLDQQYRAQDKLFALVGYFSIFTIFIACLGLFALASYTAEQRTKEIGIRKVLGASVSGIVLLLSKQFFKLILWANIIAWPLSFLIIHHWLNGFAYRIEIPVLVFVITGIITIIIALITVVFQSVKAALSDPVSSLRYE